MDKGIFAEHVETACGGPPGDPHHDDFQIKGDSLRATLCQMGDVK